MTDLLRDYQAAARDWLAPRDTGYLGDEAGLGKTRSVLTALDDRPVAVAAPAAIRDAEIWPDEAKIIGFDAPLEVVSYHELMKLDVTPWAGWQVIYDEAHRLKDRKVSWGANAFALSKIAGRVIEASGTPIPNAPHELWGQLRMIREMPAYWTWIKQWFDVYADRFSQYNISDRLKMCDRSCPPIDCDHWDEFHAANLEGWMLRRLRDDVLKDLPPLSGDRTPLWTPMTLKQARVYKDLKKDFLAEIPENGITVEALNDSAKAIKMWQCSTGLSTLDPTLPDKDSGKLAAFEEWTADRSRPTLVGCYFGNTAQALSRTMDRMKLKYAVVGGKSTRPQRLAAVRSFQAGELDVLVGQVEVIKEGLTLTAADEVQLIERPWVPGSVEQVIRRIHRMGQTRPCSVKQAVTPKSTDEYQWEVVWDKDKRIRRTLSRAELESLT